jgi:hypothetical protein
VFTAGRLIYFDPFHFKDGSQPKESRQILVVAATCLGVPSKGANGSIPLLSASEHIPNKIASKPNQLTINKQQPICQSNISL